MSSSSYKTSNNIPTKQKAEPMTKSALSSSSSSSSSGSDDSGSSSDSDTSTVSSKKKSSVQDSPTKMPQFSVTSSGLKMKIAFPRTGTPQPSMSGSHEQLNGQQPTQEKRRLPTKKLIPHNKPVTHDKSDTDSESSYCTDCDSDESNASSTRAVQNNKRKSSSVHSGSNKNASRGGSTSSGEASDSSSNSNTSDDDEKSLQEINADDLNAILPSTDTFSGSLASRSLTNNAEDSSSDMELPAIAALIRRVESESDADSARAVPRVQYNSSLLQDFVAKTQMLGNGTTSASTTTTSGTNDTKNGAKSAPQTQNAPLPRKRGRPPRQNPLPSTSNLTNGLVSESPDSGILSTVSPAPSPRNGNLSKAQIAKAESTKKPNKKPETPKYSSLASSYPMERVLYPPRRKKSSNKDRSSSHKPLSKDEALDPMWKKIDLNKKFREPCLDGYKSDGGHSICCSKRLAANSGYVSDYYGSRGKRSLSGYKSDHSVKSRGRSGYRTDFSSRAKSCGYRSDCSIRHRKKVRRKRRKKIGNGSKSAIDELSDILQLGALTLGTSSNTSSSRESIPSTRGKTPPPLLPKKVEQKLTLTKFSSLMAASKPKFGASIQVPPPKLGQASAFGKKLTLQKSAAPKLPTLSRANVEEHAAKQRKSSTKDILENLCERVTQRVRHPDEEGNESPSIKPAMSVRSKSIDGRSMKSRRTSASRRHRRMSTMSRCSSRSSRSHFKRRGRRRGSKYKSRSSLPGGGKVNDAKILLEIDQLSDSFKALCKIYGEKNAEKTVGGKGSAVGNKRGPKKRKTSDNAESSAVTTSTPATKRRNKKSAQTLTQSPDDHKLPLKKRHYLLANGERGGEISDDDEVSGAEQKRKTHDKKDFERLRAHYEEAIESCISKYGSSSPKNKDSSKNVSPKKRHLLKTTQENVTAPLSVDTKASESGKKRNNAATKISPTENGAAKKASAALLSPDSKGVTKKLRSDPSNFKSSAENGSASDKTSVGKKGKQESLTKGNKKLGHEKGSTKISVPSKTKSKQDQTSKLNKNSSNIPPGVFEPSFDLELQIPVSTINFAGKSEFSPENKGKKGNTNKAAEKVVEKLLSITGGHLLLKKKRRKAINRTGFPSKKKKKLVKVEDSGENRQKICDRVPVEGEDTKKFIERNRNSLLEDDVSPSRSLRTREKPLQDKNKSLTSKKGEKKGKREREETSPDAAPSKKVKNGPKTPRDKSSDSEPLINLTKNSKNKENDDVEKVKRNKEVPCSSSAGTKSKSTPSKRPSIEDAIKEKDKLTVSIERLPGLRIPEKGTIELKSVTPQKSRGRQLTRRSDLELSKEKSKNHEKSHSLPSTPVKNLDQITRLEKLTREFNQKFAVVKLKSLDDSSFVPSSSKKDTEIIHRPRAKSVGRGLLGKDAETDEIKRDLDLTFKRKHQERSKSVVRYIGMQPAKLMQENILQSRMRSRAKSVVRQLSPDKEEAQPRHKRAKTVARTFSAEEDQVLTKKSKESHKETSKRTSLANKKEPKTKISDKKSKETKEVPAESPPIIEDHGDLELLIPAKKLQRKKKSLKVEETTVEHPSPSLSTPEASNLPLKPMPEVDELEHDPLPYQSGVEIFFPTEVPAEKERKGKKKYLIAGLFSDYFKEDPKSRTSNAKNVNLSEVSVSLPPPPYCERYFRHTESDFQLPYDLFMATKAGKLAGNIASWHFRKLRVNIYAPDVRPTPIRPNDQQVCSCKPGYDCAENCLNRLVYTECSVETCPSGDKCQNTKIQKHENAPGLEKFMTSSKGFGVRCKLPIRKGTFISEYCGEVVTEKEFKDRMQTVYVNDQHHYCLNLDKGLVIDGHRMGSDCRFVNHSCAPNCEMQKWSVNGLSRMCLFALRDIDPLEELTYDYNFALFNPAEGQECKCGSKECRGVIGGKSQRVKPALEEDKKRSRKQKAKKNQPLIPIKYGSLLPAFVPPTEHEKLVIAEHHCFLMRNLRKVRRNNERPLCPVTTPNAPTVNGKDPTTPVSKSTTSLSVPMAAVRAPRNIRTRGLAIFEDNPELEKSARVAVVLRSVCDDIHSFKENENDAQTLISKISLPNKKKLPLYYERILNPLDLNIIEHNVEKGLYNNPRLFDEDVKRMFNNAIIFYGISSPEGAAAHKLMEFYLSIKDKAAEKLDIILGDKQLLDEFLKGLPKIIPLKGKRPKVESEDVIQCICGLYKDEGLMIQCSKCNVWQHIECTRADPEAENYLCERCDTTKKVDYEITLNEHNEDGHQYYLSLMRDDLQIRQGDTVYVLRDIPMSPDKENPDAPVRKHNYRTIGDIDFCQCDIFRVERLWKDAEGKRFVYGHHYLRPHETFHEPTRKFYPCEILRSPLYEVVPIDLVMGRCWVLDPTTFCKGRPVESAEQHVYICEMRVDKSASTFAKIPKHQYPVCTRSYAFTPFEEKLKIAKTFAPHDVKDIILPKEKKRKTKHEEVQQIPRKSSPIMQLMAQPPKTASEKRGRLEDVLARLMTTMVRVQSAKALPAVDLSYLVTGRGARQRRQNASTPVPTT
ncbi:histone-lysine N-methyltransferase ash1 [Culicoides brevitarsis]|uniref:histone-lysine N-methyltransferase ash1 n=1 Tax=Culicoides brevitarsis TaxID=469753 RepID=UPI00307C4EC9